MKLFEQETSIWYNEEGSTANIYTYNVGLMKKLTGLSKSHPDECQIKRLITTDEKSQEFIVPKSWIYVKRPREATEKQRETSRRNMVKLQVSLTGGKG